MMMMTLSVIIERRDSLRHGAINSKDSDLMIVEIHLIQKKKTHKRARPAHLSFDLRDLENDTDKEP